MSQAVSVSYQHNVQTRRLMCMIYIYSQLVKVSFVTITQFAVHTTMCMYVGPTAAPSTTCSDLAAPTNGMISYNMGTASLRPVDTVATYTCDIGYTLNGGNTTRTCESDGTWSGSPPVCLGKWNGFFRFSFRCGGRDRESGGRVFVSVSGVESFIECTCFCTGICFDLPSLTNGMISYLGAGFTNNRCIFSGATYSCNPGFTLTGGDTTRTCVSGRIWSGSPPTCKGLFCDLLLVQASEASPY